MKFLEGYLPLGIYWSCTCKREGEGEVVLTKLGEAEAPGVVSGSCS
jgi:hypothetical protein